MQLDGGERKESTSTVKHHSDDSIETSLSEEESDPSSQSKTKRSDVSKNNKVLSARDYANAAYKETHYMCPLYVNFLKNRCHNIFGSDGSMICTIPLPSEK